MKHCYGCPYLSDRAKPKEFKNDKLLLSVYIAYDDQVWKLPDN